MLLFLLTLPLLLTPVYSTEPSDQITKPFPFVGIDQHWAMDAIHCAFEKNIILDYGDGTFSPDHPVSHTDFIAMMTRSCTVHAGDDWPRGTGLAYSNNNDSTLKTMDIYFNTAPDPNALVSIQDATEV